jgi:hypothetical protein
MAGLMRFRESGIESCAIPPLRQKQERRKDGAPSDCTYFESRLA